MDGHKIFIAPEDVFAHEGSLSETTVVELPLGTHEIEVNYVARCKRQTLDLWGTHLAVTLLGDYQVNGLSFVAEFD